MKRHDRLKEIEKIWKKHGRSDYFVGTISWDDIKWEPFAVKGESHNGMEMCDSEEITKRGHFMYIWGYSEEASGWIQWDWALLRCLYTWYRLPEDCSAPLFVNESASTVCIPDIWWADSLARLFQHPDSVILGMEYVDADKAAQKAAAESQCVPQPSSKCLVEGQGFAPAPVNKTEALGFLSK